MNPLAKLGATTRRFLPGLIILAFVLGYLVRGGGSDAGPPPCEHDHDAEAVGAVAQVWTCPMHAQIKLPEAGPCPICGMPLVQTAAGGGDEGERVLKLSASAVSLADIMTVPVTRRAVEARLRLVGKVDYDETRVRTITSWVPGRLDRLFVDYTGIPVRKGDHLVLIYSPDLLTAQTEVLQALRASKELGASEFESVRGTAGRMLEAAREKLRLLGLSVEQIGQIEARGTAEDRVVIRAPIGGIVVHKNAVEGMYVQTGTRIYTIADLSRVWVKLEAYETDLPWLRYGQEVEFTTGASSGRTYSGRIAFIDPVLDERTRTVKVRINVSNEDGSLKPGMFVRAVVRPRIAEGGRVLDLDLAGKWMCPMHPEEVHDAEGACGLCGMPLVKAETLGYTSGETDGELPLVIPATAPLVTGTRAIVYVRRPDVEEPTFEGREITLGLRAGDHYIVLAGLTEGERVVARGAFKIDSALQIQGRPSMMSPPDDAPAPPIASRHEPMVGAPATFVTSLDGVFLTYLKIQTALAADAPADAATAAGSIPGALDAVATADLDEAMAAVWAREAGTIRRGAKTLASSSEIEAQREAFAVVSESVMAVADRFGHTLEKTLYRINCPMAFDGRGADWLQDDETVANPYFGDAMLRCGAEVRRFESSRKEK
jgi:membrane fusion protein, copper/silver efflux system